MRKIFTNRYRADRTNKAEIRLEEQNDKAERCRENLWKNTVERAIKTEIDARMGEKKGAGKLSWFMSKT